MLAKIKTKTKVILGFVVAFVIALIVGLAGYRGIEKLSAHINDVGNVRLPGIRGVGLISRGQLEVGYALRGLLHPKMMDAQTRAHQYEFYTDGFKLAEEGIKLCESLPKTSSEATKWKEFNTLWDEWKRTAQEIYDISKEKDRLVAAGLKLDDAKVLAIDDRAMQIAARSREAMNRAIAKLDELIELNAELSEQRIKQSASDISSCLLSMFIAIGAGAAVMILLGVVISMSVAKVLAALLSETGRLTQAAVDGQLQVRGNPDAINFEFRPIIEGINATLDAVIVPLSMAARYVDRISKGDIPPVITENYRGDFNEIKNNLNQCIAALTTMTSQGEIGQTLARMAKKDFSQQVTAALPGVYGELRDNVNAVVVNIGEAMEMLREAANQFAEGSRLAAENAQTMSQGAQTQSAGIEEMSSSIEELAQSIQRVKENAVEADSLAKQTNRLAEDGDTAVNKSSEAMELIRTSSMRIGQIIKVISEIAGQTNLLALNAAIEAARAGEHGMGFAVVADEVRKLAERSNQAAREISTLIEESTQRVEDGSRQSEETRKALKQIVEGVSATVAKISEIATATVQQAANADEVARAIQGIAEVTEHSASASEEMAANSEQLGAQAVALRELVAQFRIAEKAR